MYRALNVSESDYNRYLKPKARKRQEHRERLLIKIKEIFGEHEDNSNYGVQRILLALTQRDIKTSYSTVYRIMKQQGLLKKAKRYPNGKLYLSAVLDCFNGEIVGITLDDNMRKELCIQAFENACKARNARGMRFHSFSGFK